MPKTLIYKVKDLEPNLDEGRDTSGLWYRLTEFLNENLKPYLHVLDAILIEQQMRENTMARQAMQHTICYSMVNCCTFSNLPFIMEIDPKLKTKLLNAPKGLNETAYKKWTVEKAINILEQREDSGSLQKIRNSRKKDDLADSLLQGLWFLKERLHIPHVVFGTSED